MRLIIFPLRDQESVIYLGLHFGPLSIQMIYMMKMVALELRLFHLLLKNQFLIYQVMNEARSQEYGLKRYECWLRQERRNETGSQDLDQVRNYN